MRIDHPIKRGLLSRSVISLVSASLPDAVLALSHVPKLPCYRSCSFMCIALSRQHHAALTLSQGITLLLQALFQWRSYGWARTGLCPPNHRLCPLSHSCFDSKRCRNPRLLTRLLHNGQALCLTATSTVLDPDHHIRQDASIP